MSVQIAGNRVFITVISGRISPIKSGTLIADGLEQTLIEFIDVGRVGGYVDLGNMQLSDKVVIRQYMKMVAGGSYGKYADETYDGVQIPRILYIKPKETDVALKITLQQTQGVNKSFEYNFFREL